MNRFENEPGATSPEQMYDEDEIETGFIKRASVLMDVDQKKSIGGVLRELEEKYPEKLYVQMLDQLSGDEIKELVSKHKAANQLAMEINEYLDGNL